MGEQVAQRSDATSRLMEPIPLDSSRWKELVHVYGSGEDMPEAILRLEKLDHINWDENGPLEKIAAAIYHQGDPNTGSYATVPHLVRIAEGRPPNEQLPIVALCSWIEQYRTAKRPRIPDDLEPAYRHALVRAKDIAITMLTAPGDSWGAHGFPYDFRCVFAAIAALSGERRIAGLLDHLDEFEFCYRKVHGDDYWPPWPE
jgi:hypothetical protein